MKELWTRGNDFLGETTYHHFGSNFPYSFIFYCVHCGTVYGARTVVAERSIYLAQGGRCSLHADGDHPSTLIPDLSSIQEIRRAPPLVLALYLEETSYVCPDFEDDDE